MSRKKILVVGSGGREDALAWRIAQSPDAEKVYVAPGNGGTGRFGDAVPISATDGAALADFAGKKGIDLTIVCPDNSLAAGVVDVFLSRKFPVVGPTKDAATIESSKADAKAAMVSAGVPTAPFEVFNGSKDALDYIRHHPGPCVVKASGLALGKGTYMCYDSKAAEAAIKEIMVDRVYGDAGDLVVIEKMIEGPEISLHALCDGKSSILLWPSQDYKRVGDGNVGPNTGGMGAIAPIFLSARELAILKTTTVDPILRQLATTGRPFVGCLYPGLMMTESGPMVLEYNARMGDPETQVLVRLLRTNPLELFWACAHGTLADCLVEWTPGFAVCVVMAAANYPAKSKSGLPITGIDKAEKIPGVVVYHANTAIIDGKLVTAGGRVLNVTALGGSLREAREAAYEAVSHIQFEGAKYRTDIGKE